MKSILVIIACAVAGYVVVMLLMNTKADDLRPPGDRDDPDPAPPATPRGGDEPRPSAPVRSLPSPRPSTGGDWTLLLDVPRSASERDIEAAFRRQLGKAEAVGDREMAERLKQARAAALADRKKG
jgi:hypothetical protein